jgi:hypothetical protein
MRFTEETVAAAGCDWDEASATNRDLDNLASQRVPVLPITNAIIKSKIAWKLSDLRLSMTHRLVDLAEAAIEQWEKGNLLAGVILGRALFETIAIVQSVCMGMRKGIENRDLNALDALAMRSLFGGKLANEEALNVLTAMGRLDKELPGAKDFYLRELEMAHPNSLGMHQFYSSIDGLKLEVSYSREKRTQKEMFPRLMVVLSALRWAVKKFDEMDLLVDEVAEIHSMQESSR